MKNKFFGSTLNTILLAILIILMIIALVWMNKNKDVDVSMGLKDKDGKTTEVESSRNTTPRVEPEILGNKDDLMYISIRAGQEVSGKQAITGSIKGGYFFEGSMPINVLDTNKKVIKATFAKTSGNWMANNVPFATNIDFTNIKKGPGYVEIHNDNASGEPANDKSILIPVIIK